MCPIRTHPDQLPLPLEHSATGSRDSTGPTGAPSLLELLSGQTVRVHRGLSTISAGSLIVTEEIPATFTALKRDEWDVYTVMLSCALTSTQYAALIAALEGPPAVNGVAASVGVRFEPLTPNLVPPTTAPSI